MPNSIPHSDADERSPLVSPAKPSDEFQRQLAAAAAAAAAEEDVAAVKAHRNQWNEQASKSTWYLILLTLSIGG